VSCAYLACAWAKRVLLRASAEKSPGICVVLYYHTVAPSQRERFARQMDILLRHANPIRADFEAPLPHGRRFACVTFDDAMTSFVENALPELEKRGIPGTVFAASGKLGRRPDWGNYSNEPLPSESTITEAQLGEIADRVLIGSHTVSHPMLTRLSEKDAKCELDESRRTLQGMLNKKVTLFSFPYGDFNERLIKWTKEVGYERVFTTLPLPVESGAEASVIGRVTVEPTDWPTEFRLKLFGAYQWLPVAFAVKRKIRSLFRGARNSKDRA
jgi:peptidoglycan/xylan/chitin deacetylase (PgdA/CDA1 family)